MEPQRVVRELRCVIAGTVERHGGEADLALSAADQVFHLDGLVAEVERRQLVDIVAMPAAFEHEGEQQRVVDRRHRDAMTPEHLERELGVVADLEDAGVLQQGPETLERAVARDLSQPRSSPSTSARWPKGM